MSSIDKLFETTDISRYRYFDGIGTSLDTVMSKRASYFVMTIMTFSIIVVFIKKLLNKISEQG